VTATLELGAHCESQASSPAQDGQSEESGRYGISPGMQVALAAASSVQTVESGDLLLATRADLALVDRLDSYPTRGGYEGGWPSDGVANTGETLDQPDRLLAKGLDKTGGQRLDGWSGAGVTNTVGADTVSCPPHLSLMTTSLTTSDERCPPSLPVLPTQPTTCILVANDGASDHSILNGGHSDEQSSDRTSSHWLKPLLPGSQSGCWEVVIKDNRLVARFRWRDPHRETLSFPKFTGEELRILEEFLFDEAVSLLRERISADLLKMSLDPKKKDKALVVAEKLGIDLAVKAVNTSIDNRLQS